MVEKPRKANWWKVVCLVGLAVALTGALGVLLFAEAAVSAVMPHGTPSEMAIPLLIGSLCTCGIGAIAFAIGGLGWLARRLDNRP